MARIFQSGAETNNITAEMTAATNATIVTDRVRTGAYAYKCPTGAAATVSRRMSDSTAA